MADCQGKVAAENESNKADNTQEELEDLEKQSLENENSSKDLNTSSIEGQSDVRETTESLSPEFVIPTTPVEMSSIDASQATNKVLETCISNDGGGRSRNVEKASVLSAHDTLNLQPIGIECAEDWDKELQEQGIKQPDFKLKKEDAIKRDADIITQENINLEFSGSTSPSPSTCTTQDSPSTSTCSTTQDSTQSLYHIKWIKWKNINTPIITQNENGPCPLIALINALILQRKISIPSMQEIVSANQLMEYLGDCILDQAPERLPEGAQLNYEQNMADAIAIMSKLQTGLDVNVKFTGVADFEFTPECVVFDLLNIRLMHGWLVDPQNHEAVIAIGNLSYNQLVEKIIASKQDGADPDLVTGGLIAESFLDQSAAQLTYHGLYELNVQMGEEELCIFFRNNHFNTLFKHKNELFILATDQGFLTEDKVMWETLSNVEGDSYFVDANFRTLPASQPPLPTVPSTAPNLPSSPGTSQEDQDYLVALSLQEEHTREREQEAGASVNVPPQQPDPSAAMTSQEWSDMQLAMQLQEEEQRQQQRAQQQQQQQQQHAQQQARSSAVVPRGSPGHAANPPPPVHQQPRQQNPPPQQGAQQNKECTIL